MKNIKSLSLTLIISLLLLISCFMAYAIPVNAEEDYLQDLKSQTETSIDIINIDGISYSVEYSYLNVLNIYYTDILDYCNQLNVEVDKDISFKTFCEVFYAQNELMLSDYVDYVNYKIENKAETHEPIHISDLEYKPSSVSINSKENDDIIENNKLPRQPVYAGVYNIKTGDILYEQGDYKHTAIVVGLKNDDNYGSYWQTVESLNPSGVVRSFIDDNRLTSLQGVFLRVYEANDSICDKAVKFCESQLGCGYEVELLKPSKDKTKWMCSALVWAGYYYGGNIDICPESVSCFPTDIYNSSRTYVVNLIDCRYLKFSVLKSYYTFPAYYSWDIKITNPNNFDVDIEYNSRLCFEGDAKNFKNLKDIETDTIKKNSSKTYKIEHNGTADYAVARILYTINNSTYSLVTYANKLSYSNNVGTCEQKNLMFLA